MQIRKIHSLIKRFLLRIINAALIAILISSVILVKDVSAAVLQFDIYSLFNADVAVNRNDGVTDPVNTGIDDQDRAYFTQTAVEEICTSDPDPHGLPDNGLVEANSRHPAIQLGVKNSDDGNNAFQGQGNSNTGAIDIPDDNYTYIHIFAISTNGDTPVTLTFHYSDGSNPTTTQRLVKDWFDDPVETDDEYFLINGLDWTGVSASGCEDFDDPAIFGLRFQADETKTMTSFTINYDTSENEGGSFILFGASGQTEDAAPEISVEGNSTPIEDEDASPSTLDDTDFGDALVGTETVQHTFTIFNTGDAELDLTDDPRVTISVSDFSLESDAATSISSGGGSSDFTVTFDPSASGIRTATVSIANDDLDENPYNFLIQGNGLVVPEVTTSSPANGATLQSTSTLTVTFNVDMVQDGSADAANNVNNYILVEANGDGFQTTSCASGVSGNDTRITILSAIYSNNGGAGPFQATLGFAPLENGSYRLLACGSATIYDLSGTPLNNGSDTTVNFTIADELLTDTLPETGFAPDQVTLIPEQDTNLSYIAIKQLSISIPILEVKAPIVGIPISNDGWDLTWLGNQAGWLHGTAFPSWAGNSALTAHVYNEFGKPGPFHDLSQLKWGDSIFIESAGQLYQYEVRTVEEFVRPTDLSSLFQHEEYPWLTLITCRGYNEESDTYNWRVVVRAVQTGIQ